MRITAYGDEIEPRSAENHVSNLRRYPKISAAQRGKIRGAPSDETRSKISAALMGRKMSAEWRAKISATRKGRPIPSLRGRKLTAEHRAKLSASKAGHIVTAETKAKMSAAHTRYRTPEEKRIADCLRAQRHNAFRRNAPGNGVTVAEWGEVLQTANGRCHYCHQERKLTMDHIVPTSRGGAHDRTNVVAACGRCNSSKCDRIAPTTIENV